jgi:hemolysin III
LPSQRQPFSAPKFLVVILLQFAGLLLAIRFLAPAAWSRQVAAGPWAIALVFLAGHLATCFFEWFFHRYLLHSITILWLQRLANGHRNHHSLTPIQLARDEAGPGRIVLNRYPIVEEEQLEDAVFPVYSLLAFWLVFTPPIVVLQLLFPHAPVLVGGYAAVTWAMISYEIFHAIEHLPYEWWARAVEHPRFAWVWRRLYGFHHFHHANVGSNEAISGFFGLPVADWVFRTYHQPAELLLQGRTATAKEFQVHAPWSFVVAWDRWARKREAKLRQSRA